jgi:hypothetical protein
LIAALSGITASNNGTVITITADDVGTAGNSYDMALGGHNTGTMSISGSNLTGGENAGTGARTVLITGLDSNYREISETVNLNGTSNVNTVNSYRMIQSMTVTSVGSGATNAGAITATAATDSTVTSTIVASAGRSNEAVYMVPAKKTAYITAVHGSVQKAAAAAVDIDLIVKEYGEAEVIQHTLGLQGGVHPVEDHEFGSPIVVGEKSLIKLNGTSGSANADVSGGFDILIRNNQG